MMMRHLAGRLFGRPILASEALLLDVAGLVAPRVLGGAVRLSGPDGVRDLGGPDPRLGILDNPIGRDLERSQRTGFPVIDGVGVITISGPLVAKGEWLGDWCGTSYEGLLAQVARARADGSVRGVVFDVDSGGGEASMAWTVAREIAALSAEKPVMAILTEMAASAAYLIVSPARQIIIPETGFAGSIGVLMLHVNRRPALEREGYEISLLRSGAHKAEGHPMEQLSDDTRARWQVELDQTRVLFAETVARGRGARLTAAAALATEAALLRGQEAVDAGLADVVGDPLEAFREFRAAIRARG